MNYKIRVAHLVSHPIQYFAPLYRALASKPELDLTIYFYSRESIHEHFDRGFGRKLNWDVPLLDGYNYRLPAEGDEGHNSSRFDWRPSWWILQELRRNQYDIIWLHGYALLNSWLAIAMGHLTGTPVLMREEQTLLTPRSSLKRLAKRLLLPLIYRNVTGLYIGENSRKCFEHYGTRRLFPVRYCVDNESFRKQYLELKLTRNRLRQQLGIEGPAPVILFSGKLVDKKQPQLLLEAFRRIRQVAECHLVFVGDGPLRARLETAARSLAIPDVHFVGFLNQSKLASAYTAADLFVLPSAYDETWGLVVNEAMNFNLPVIVSDRVGCAADLVRPGENGLIFRSGNADDLSSAMLSFVQSEDLRMQYGARSGEIIQAYSIAACAEQVLRACETVLATRTLACSTSRSSA